MTLAEGIVSLATRIASEIKSLRAELSNKADKPKPVGFSTYPTYTLTVDDANRTLVAGRDEGTTTIYVPANVFQQNDRIDVLGLNGLVSFEGIGGMSLYATPSLSTRAKASAVTILILETDVGVVVGDLASP